MASMTKWRFPVSTEEKSENTAGDDGAITSERSVLTFQKNLLSPKSGNLTKDKKKIHTSHRKPQLYHYCGEPVWAECESDLFLGSSILHETMNKDRRHVHGQK
jgi:hypothetical protein